MKTFTEQPVEKIYWTIGEVATRLNISRTAIRFWEKPFGLHVGKRNHHGDRIFSRNEVELLDEIHRLLKVELYTIPGARRQLEIAGVMLKKAGKPKPAELKMMAEEETLLRVI